MKIKNQNQSSNLENLMRHIHEEFADEISQVNKLILNLSGNRAELIAIITNYLISAGGKRLRPIMTLLSSRICGYQSGNYNIILATAIEFIHNATLLHDDVVDGSLVRRGAATANNKWGNKASILVGDFLLSQAFQLMVQSNSLKVLDILSSASAVISEGEILQLAATNHLGLSQDDYIKVVSAKTAELFAAACQVGAVISNQNDKEMSLRSYGMNFGIAFQIIDDSLDYYSDNKGFGKELGNDFFEGKVTLPVIIAYDRANKNEKLFWQRTIAEMKQKPEDLNEALKLINKYNAIDKSINVAISFIDNARNSLEIFEDSPTKQIMLDLLDFCVRRSY